MSLISHDGKDHVRKVRKLLDALEEKDIYFGYDFDILQSSEEGLNISLNIALPDLSYLEETIEEILTE